MIMAVNTGTTKPVLPRTPNGNQDSDIRRASQRVQWSNNHMGRGGSMDLAALIRRILGQLGNVQPNPTPAPAPAPIPGPIQPVYGVIAPPPLMAQPVYGVIQPAPIQAIYGSIQGPVFGADSAQ